VIFVSGSGELRRDIGREEKGSTVEDNGQASGTDEETDYAAYVPIQAAVLRQVCCTDSQSYADAGCQTAFNKTDKPRIPLVAFRQSKWSTATYVAHQVKESLSATVNSKAKGRITPQGPASSNHRQLRRKTGSIMPSTYPDATSKAMGRRLLASAFWSIAWQ
jgi:hypothetical protein